MIIKKSLCWDSKDKIRLHLYLGIMIYEMIVVYKMMLSKPKIQSIFKNGEAHDKILFYLRQKIILVGALAKPTFPECGSHRSLNGVIR